MNQVKRKRKKKSQLLKVSEIMLDHGGHVGVEKGISTRQIAKILRWKRWRVTRQMYPVMKYFRPMGKVLCSHKPPKLDRLYFFGATTEERHSHITGRVSRKLKELKSVGKEIEILSQEDPQLKFSFGPERIENGILLSIEAHSEKTEEE